MKKLLTFVSLFLLLTRCAQMVSPTGGKKDETPPQLLSSIPENKAINFKESTISLTFDEYIVIDNLMQKLIITPETDNPYTPTVKNQTVNLKFRQPFTDSTTYTFNFSDGIKDLAERNPAQNLKLVFSTGAVIDSGRVYGTVKNIRNNEPAFDVLVGLYHLSDTLDPQKIKPYYFSRTDSSGRFEIENTQIANFSLIAIADKNHNLLYNPKEESIAFLDSIVKVNSDTSDYQLSMFHSDVTPLRVQRTIPKVNDYTLVFNKGIDQLIVHFEDKKDLFFHLESPTQLKFFNVPAQTDTVFASIQVTDSLGYDLTIDQKITFLPQRSRERQRTPFIAKSNLPTGDPVEPSFRFNVQFNKPVSLFDSTLFSVTADSAVSISPEQLELQWSANRTELDIGVTTKAKDSVIVNFEKGAFLSIEEDTLAPTKYKHPILNPANFGVIRGTVSNPENLPFVIELTDSEFKTVLAEASESPFEFRNLKPGSYRMRLFIDFNRNGRWDTGNYSRKVQPEQILVFPSELLIKANFEYEDQYFDLSNRTNP